MTTTTEGILLQLVSELDSKLTDLMATGSQCSESVSVLINTWKQLKESSEIFHSSLAAQKPDVTSEIVTSGASCMCGSDVII